MNIKAGVIIVVFFIMGLIVSKVTGKYFYYIPSSLVVGIIVALAFSKNIKS